MKRSTTAGVIAVSALFCGALTYLTLDVADVAPGFLTARPALPTPVAPPTWQLPRSRPTVPASAGNLHSASSSATYADVPSLNAQASGQLPDQQEVTLAAEELIRNLEKEAPGSLVGISLLDSATGESLYQHNDEKLLIPASTTKLFAAATGVRVLGAGNTYPTVVKRNGKVLTLVGGGDQLLGTQAPKPLEIAGRGSLHSLAVTTANSLKAEGITTVALQYQTNLWGTQERNPAWREAGNDSFTGSVTPLAVNAGEISPYKFLANPALGATKDFAAALQAQGINVEGTVQSGIASATAAEVARVESAPVNDILVRVLKTSDNTLADGTCRAATVKARLAPTFAGEVQAVNDTVKEFRINPELVQVKGCSGLAQTGKIAPRALTEALQQELFQPKYGSVVAGLPVLGFDQKVAQRLPEQIGAGRIRAKTGSLSGVRALAGYLVTTKGRVLTFAVLINGSEGSEDKQVELMDAFLDKVVQA